MTLGKSASFGWIVLAANLCLAAAPASASHGQAYLPRLGPTGFRMLPPPAPDAPKLPEILISPPPISLRDTSTNAALIEPEPAPDAVQPPQPQPAVSMLPQPIPADPGEPAPKSAANDLLIISPQMLIEYFKPHPGATGAVSVLAPVSFTPATPASAPSSRAIYKTE